MVTTSVKIILGMECMKVEVNSKNTILKVVVYGLKRE